MHTVRIPKVINFGENIVSKYVTSNEIKINGKVFNISKYSNIYTVAFGMTIIPLFIVIIELIALVMEYAAFPKATV